MSPTTRTLTVLCIAATLTGGLVLAAGEATAATRPATSTAHHVSVSLPSRAAAHGRTAAVSATTAAVRGAKVQVVGSRVTAYQHGRRVASGRTLHLRPGSYRVAATVDYRRYRVVTQHVRKTVRTLHRGGYPAALCTVTAVDSSHDDGVFDIIRLASCHSPSYPGRTSVVTGEVLSNYPQGTDRLRYKIGDVLKTHQVFFSSYYSTSTQVVTHHVQHAGAVHRFTTPRSALVVARHG